MPETPEEPAVVHDAARQEFQLDLEGEVAVLRYAPSGDGVVEIYSTYVPDSRRGRGAAGRLATVALDHARAHGLKVVPSCSYVAEFIQRHPAYADLVV